MKCQSHGSQFKTENSEIYFLEIKSLQENLNKTIYPINFYCCKLGVALTKTVKLAIDGTALKCKLF